VHRYKAVTPNPNSDGRFGKNLDHNIWVDEHSGKWAHEAGYARTNMATGRGHGNDFGSLKKYIGSGKYKDPKSMARAGEVWKYL
jgi:hypothetical protein